MTSGRRVCTVGTLIAIDDTVHMVSGYRMIEHHGMTELAYLMVPYPLGIVGVEDVSLVLADAELNVISTGYEDESSSEFMNLLEKAWEEGRHTPYSTYRAAMEERYDLILGDNDE